MRDEITHVIYHGRCPDGFTAAWAAWKHLGDKATYIPAGYGKPAPELPPEAGVAIVDFSYPRAELEALRARVAELVVLDHHKTAQADLEGLTYARFDMGHSGAYLAWDWFNGPDEGDGYGFFAKVPAIVRYVEDRDLWRWKLEKSREISAWLGSVPMTFEDWDRAARTLEVDWPSAVRAGEAILRAKGQAVQSMADSARWRELGGHRIPYANATVYFSEVGEELCKRYPEAPFSAYYLDRADGKRQWGLRGREGGVDVSAVAKALGGGGHAAAAGFTEELGT